MEAGAKTSGHMVDKNEKQEVRGKGSGGKGRGNQYVRHRYVQKGKRYRRVTCDIRHIIVLLKFE